MRLIRSWPHPVPPHRAHVVDDIEHLVLSNYHYGPLAAVDDDVLLLEWDIAVGQVELRRFISYAVDDPSSVRVAPYLIYGDAYNIDRDVWAHRWWGGEGLGTTSALGARSVVEGDPVCQLFGLGMVYLPRDVLRAWFAAGWSTHFGDVEFSMWHYQYVTRDVPICWDVRPVHLNFDLAKVELPR